MKKLGPIIVIIVIIGVIISIFLNLAEQKGMVTLKKGNFDGKPLPIELHHYQDSQCGMVIDSLEYASEVIAPMEYMVLPIDPLGGIVKRWA